MQPRLRVAIIGGGIGGLTLAVALSHSPDIEIDVYEAAREFAEVGAGVGVWQRAWKILAKLGLEEDLAQVAFVPPLDTPKVGFQFRKGNQREGVTFQQLMTSGGLTSFYRPDFQRVLLRHLSRRCKLHTSKRFVSYANGGDRQPIQLYFEDGTTSTCDLLVAADGLKSAVRACMLKGVAARLQAEGKRAEATEALRHVMPSWSGMMAYRTSIDADVLRKKYPGHRVLTTPQLYLGKDTQVTCYTMARGTRVNFAAFRARYHLQNTPLDVPWVQDVTPDEIADDFDGWEAEVQALVECVDATSRWAIHTVGPLKSYVDGRVILLGDAAHAMMPFQGAGAGMAIEDAFILAALLNREGTQRKDLARAAAVYDAIRRPFSQHVAELSAENGKLYTLNHPDLVFDDGHPIARPDDPRLQKTFAWVRDNWTWAWDTTIDRDLERALAMFTGR